MKTQFKVFDNRISKLQRASAAAVRLFQTAADSLAQINEQLYTKNDECAEMMAALSKTQISILTSIEANEKIREKLLGIIEGELYDRI